MYDRGTEQRFVCWLAVRIPREFTSVWCSPGSTASAAEERAEAGSDKHVRRKQKVFSPFFFKCSWRFKYSVLWRSSEQAWLFISQQAALQSTLVHPELSAFFLLGCLLRLYFVLFLSGERSVWLLPKATCTQRAQELGKCLRPTAWNTKYKLLVSKKHPKRGGRLEKCPDIQYLNLTHHTPPRSQAQTHRKAEVQQFWAVPAHCKSEIQDTWP